MSKLQVKLTTALLVFISIVIMLALANAAFAQTTQAGSVSNSGASAGASAGAVSYSSPAGYGGAGGRASSANQNVVGSGNTYEASDLSERVPGVIMPALTTSNGTCMGSTSGGIGISGFGGSFGSTYTSNPCNVRFNANQMNALGEQALALEIMCSQDSVYEADLRQALAGGKQRCVPRDEQGGDPVASWFPDEGQDAVSMIGQPHSPFIMGER